MVKSRGQKVSTKNKKLYISFDPKDREYEILRLCFREYLTGFHKRKVEKKKQYIAKKAKKHEQFLKEQRKEIEQEKKKLLEKYEYMFENIPNSKKSDKEKKEKKEIKKEEVKSEFTKKNFGSDSVTVTIKEGLDDE